MNYSNGQWIESLSHCLSYLDARKNDFAGWKQIFLTLKDLEKQQKRPCTALRSLVLTAGFTAIHLHSSSLKDDSNVFHSKIQKKVRELKESVLELQNEWTLAENEVDWTELESVLDFRLISHLKDHLMKARHQDLSEEFEDSCTIEE